MYRSLAVFRSQVTTDPFGQPADTSVSHSRAVRVTCLDPGERCSAHLTPRTDRIHHHAEEVRSPSAVRCTCGAADPKKNQDDQTKASRGLNRGADSLETHRRRVAVGVVHATPGRQRSQPAHGKPQRNRHLHLDAEPDRLPPPEHVGRCIQPISSGKGNGARDGCNGKKNERQSPKERERERERDAHRGQTNMDARWAGRPFL